MEQDNQNVHTEALQTDHRVEAVDVEALIALIEERVIEHLTRIVERMVQQQAQSGGGGVSP